MFFFNYYLTVLSIPINVYTKVFLACNLSACSHIHDTVRLLTVGCSINSCQDLYKRSTFLLAVLTVQGADIVSLLTDLNQVNGVVCVCVGVQVQYL